MMMSHQGKKCDSRVCQALCRHLTPDDGVLPSWTELEVLLRPNFDVSALDKGYGISGGLLPTERVDTDG
jgi:hypothetical protein